MIATGKGTLTASEAVAFTDSTGSPQLFEAAFPEGPVRQLTEGPVRHPPSPARHAGGEDIVFTRGGSIWTVRRETLAERYIIDFRGAQLGECSLTADGEWLTAAARSGAEAGLVGGDPAPVCTVSGATDTGSSASTMGLQPAFLQGLRE